MSPSSNHQVPGPSKGRVVGIVRVNGPKPYEVVVGRGVRETAAAMLPDRVIRVAVFHQPALSRAADEVISAVTDLGHEVVRLQLPDGEAAKTAAEAARCWEALGTAGLTRTDAAIAIGGGATTDMAGFVAATWLRGIPIVHVPSTLLGMVDAAVGGKTGINTSAGKNLVGSFHPPAAVICDLDLLQTLAQSDYTAGMAEVVKAGFIADGHILELVEQQPEQAIDPTTVTAEQLIVRSIRVKAHVVADDLTESVDRELGREILNYGHTLAHAIERAENYQWRHGDAVAVGMVFAAALSVAAGRLAPEGLARHRSILDSLGLPTTYRGAGADELLAAMYLDKKTRGRTLRFIVLDDFGRPGLLEAPDPEWLGEAFAEVLR